MTLLSKQRCGEGFEPEGACFAFLSNAMRIANTNSLCIIGFR